PKMRAELLFQGTPCLDEQAAVDGLVRHLECLIGRELQLKPSRDLFRRPLQRQQLCDQAAKGCVLCQETRLGPASPLPGILVGLAGTIAPVTVVGPRRAIGASPAWGELDYRC